MIFTYPDELIHENIEIRKISALPYIAFINLIIDGGIYCKKHNENTFVFILNHLQVNAWVADHGCQKPFKKYGAYSEKPYE